MEHKGHRGARFQKGAIFDRLRLKVLTAATMADAWSCGVICIAFSDIFSIHRMLVSDLSRS
jgi:hypothetical protein